MLYKPDCENVSLNPYKKKYTRSKNNLSAIPIIPKLIFTCQLRVMEMKIVTTEAGVVELIYGPGHLQDKS